MAALNKRPQRARFIRLWLISNCHLCELRAQSFPQPILFTGTEAEMKREKFLWRQLITGAARAKLLQHNTELSTTDTLEWPFKSWFAVPILEPSTLWYGSADRETYDKLFLTIFYYFTPLVNSIWLCSDCKQIRFVSQIRSLDRLSAPLVASDQIRFVCQDLG